VEEFIATVSDVAGSAEDISRSRTASDLCKPLPNRIDERIDHAKLKNYKRDYKQERATSLARGEAPNNAARKRARRSMEAEGKVKPFDGKDVDHVVPLSKVVL